MSKNVYALCLIVFFSLFQPTRVIAWDSVGSAPQMDTHKLIAEQAVTILENDVANDEPPEFLDNLAILSENL